MAKKIKKVIRSPLGRIGLALAVPFAGPAIGAGLGLSGLTAATVGSGLAGAGAGVLGGGGLKSALLGGATGAAGGYIGSGGNVPGLGSIGKNVPLSGYGPSQAAPSGILGSASKTLGSIAGSGAGGGSSLFSGNGLSNILGGIQASSTNDQMEEEQLKAQQLRLKALSPYTSAGADATQRLQGNLAEGFNPGDLTQDPGYQFNLNEGMKTLDRTNAARGSFYSGAALKQAQDYGQGLADNTYNTAYQRWLSNNNQLANASGQGLNAAGAVSGIQDDIGNVKSNATLSKNNILQGSLSSLLSGSGARQVIGYRQDGTPIYADEATASQYAGA